MLAVHKTIVSPHWYKTLPAEGRVNFRLIFTGRSCPGLRFKVASLFKLEQVLRLLPARLRQAGKWQTTSVSQIVNFAHP